MQGSMEDSFGIPSLASTRKNEFTDCADGRLHFTICNVPNTETTQINEGKTAVDVSDVKLQSGYTDCKSGIYFPNDGMMYVILFDIPDTYKIARYEVSDLRECVMCGDERPHNDRGVAFGKCGHYICHQCCKDYPIDMLNKVKRCFYCRRPTNVKLDGADLHEASTQQLPQKRPGETITTTDTSMKLIMQRLQQM